MEIYNQVIDQSHMTAIKRNKISAPMQYLRSQGLLEGRILDYGCGRGEDVAILKAMGHDIIGYDPYWAPIPLTGTGLYGTITCIYVMNCISDREIINDIARHMLDLTSQTGSIYIAVRNDIKNLTEHKERGTFQGEVELSGAIIDTIVTNSTFKIWRIPKTAGETI